MMALQDSTGDEKSVLLTKKSSSYGGAPAGNLRSNTSLGSLSGNLRSNLSLGSSGNLRHASRSPRLTRNRLSRNGLSNSIASIGSAHWDWPSRPRAPSMSSLGSVPRKQSFVLAPEELNLPPQTALMGSSKLVANASLAELRRSANITPVPFNLLIEDGLDGNSLSNDDGNFLLLETMSDNIENAHTLKEIESEFLRRSMTAPTQAEFDQSTEASTSVESDDDCERPTVRITSLPPRKATRPRPSVRDSMPQPSFLRAQKTFYKDLTDFSEGSIPQSIVIATCIGCVCGMVAFLYYTVLDGLLDLIWKGMPEKYVIDQWPEHFYVLWIPLVTVTLSICCGLSIYFLGEPGDLAYTVKCLHEKGYKDTHHIIPMVAASLFTILSGASLGPEAPLVAICAAVAGFISKKIFKQSNTNVIRKHTFMGMAGALAAFFGVPLGGSLFALEVASRHGIEWFEHLIESIYAGEVCVVIFRSLARLPLQQLWANDSTPSVGRADPYLIVVGAAIGLLGAAAAFLFANFHWRLMAFFGKLGLLDDDNRFAVPRVLLGVSGVLFFGMLIPQTMFWGEFEFPVLATLSPVSALPHVWPTSGLLNFEMDSCLKCLLVGFCKLLAISFTVAGGYRGGFIFPFFTAGAAFGRALCFPFPNLSPVISTLCFAAGINVAITRTALATSLILAFLSGEQLALPSILAASIASLFATSYMPFIKSQIARSDIDHSLYVDT